MSSRQEIGGDSESEERNAYCSSFLDKKQGCSRSMNNEDSKDTKSQSLEPWETKMLLGSFIAGLFFLLLTYLLLKFY